VIGRDKKSPNRVSGGKSSSVARSPSASAAAAPKPALSPHAAPPSTVVSSSPRSPSVKPGIPQPIIAVHHERNLNIPKPDPYHRSVSRNASGGFYNS
jgi:hypothetical protein